MVTRRFDDQRALYEPDESSFKLRPSFHHRMPQMRDAATADPITNNEMNLNFHPVFNDDGTFLLGQPETRYIFRPVSVTGCLDETIHLQVPRQ